ncbi:MAG: Ig-like domain-containing protein, partial [Luteibacter jiangsuensis]
AKASYGSNPVSTPWVVTVTQQIVPAITGVRDSSGDVANGGSTEDTTLTLSGTAQPNQQVDILDGSTSKGTAAVDENGAWSLTISGLTVAAHSFTAKARYGSNPVSAPWVVTVTQPLTVDPTEMILNGPRVFINGWPSTGADLPGNTKTRQASGGRPPYTYRSNQYYATVTQNGKVTGRRNGTATISITDADHRTVSYPVKVSGVYRLLMNEGPLTHVSQALTWMAQQGGSPVSREFSESMFTLYDMRWATKHYWYCTQEGCESYGFYTFFNYETVSVSCAKPDSGLVKAAWCLKPYD